MESKVVSVPSPTAVTSKPRPLAKFHPNIWGDYFTSISSTNLELESYEIEVEELKEKVKTMLLTSTNDLIQNITLIDLLCRLGVSYHFEKIIDEQLQHIFVDVKQKIVSCNHEIDLYTSANLFRVLRQHGYKVLCEILHKFTNNDGKFKTSISSDVKGMLSLLEAAHLRLHGEDILEEALVFTKTHLEAVVLDHPSHLLTKQILQALDQPLHRGIPRLEARRYISFYQEDECRDETLLKFVELDFNRVQLLHRQELGLITRWYEESAFEARLSYIRNRVVECYFWIQGVYFEPHYSCARIILTKIIAIISMIDDTYDSYGTVEELVSFTDAIQRLVWNFSETIKSRPNSRFRQLVEHWVRLLENEDKFNVEEGTMGNVRQQRQRLDELTESWDASVLDQLPDYMEFFYRAILDFYQGVEKEMTQKGRAYSVKYAVDGVKELVYHYLAEAKWADEGYVPSFDEYIKNALGTSACYALSVSSFVGMTGIATEDAFEWIHSQPKCVKACQAIGRLMNDIKGHKVEQQRRHVVSAVESYMNQYGVPEEKAVEEINKRMIEDAWKDLNDECMKPTTVSMDVLMRVVNLTRTMDAIYKFDDGYTNTHQHLKSYITSLFVDPIVQKQT